MGKFVTKIALMLFMVFGLAVNVVNGAMITSREQEAIDILKAEYLSTLEKKGYKRPTLKQCLDRVNVNNATHLKERLYCTI